MRTLKSWVIVAGFLPVAGLTLSWLPGTWSSETVSPAAIGRQLSDLLIPNAMAMMATTETTDTICTCSLCSKGPDGSSSGSKSFPCADFSTTTFVKKCGLRNPVKVGCRRGTCAHVINVPVTTTTTRGSDSCGGAGGGLLTNTTTVTPPATCDSANGGTVEQLVNTTPANPLQGPCAGQTASNWGYCTKDADGKIVRITMGTPPVNDPTPELVRCGCQAK